MVVSLLQENCQGFQKIPESHDPKTIKKNCKALGIRHKLIEFEGANNVVLNDLEILERIRNDLYNLYDYLL